MSGTPRRPPPPNRRPPTPRPANGAHSVLACQPRAPLRMPSCRRYWTRFGGDGGLGAEDNRRTIAGQSPDNRRTIAGQSPDNRRHEESRSRFSLDAQSGMESPTLAPFSALVEGYSSAFSGQGRAMPSRARTRRFAWVSLSRTVLVWV